MFTFRMGEWKKGHLLKEATIEDGSSETRTHKVFHCMSEGCLELDLPEPIWLEQNIRDFQRHAKCRFTQDSFVEEIPFDYLQVEIAEEDDWFF